MTNRSLAAAPTPDSKDAPELPMTCPNSSRSNCALFDGGKRPSKEWYAAKIQETLDDDFSIGTAECDLPPQGWYCTRDKGHEGPCAAWPSDASTPSKDAPEAGKPVAWMYTAKEQNVNPMVMRQPMSAGAMARDLWDEHPLYLHPSAADGAREKTGAQVISEPAGWRDALQFYAERSHFGIADESAWDTVSGEPANFWCDEAGTATVEDGTVAAQALAGTPLQNEDGTLAAAQPPVDGAQERDAARYRWLRKHECALINQPDEDGIECLVTMGNSRLDEAIDAALSAGKGEAGQEDAS